MSDTAVARLLARVDTEHPAVRRPAPGREGAHLPARLDLLQRIAGSSRITLHSFRRGEWEASLYQPGGGLWVVERGATLTDSIELLLGGLGAL